MSRLSTLQQNLLDCLGDQADVVMAFDELTLTVSADQWVAVAERLRDEPNLKFESCVDLCGMDYLTYGQGKEGQPEAAVPVFPARYAVVVANRQ